MRSIFRLAPARPRAMLSSTWEKAIPWVERAGFIPLLFTALSALPPLTMLLRACIKSGNPTACTALLADATSLQLDLLLLEIGRATSINRLTWAQAVFHERGFLNKERMAEIDETRDRIERMLQSIADVAYKQLEKKKTPTLKRVGASAGC